MVFPERAAAAPAAAATAGTKRSNPNNAATTPTKRKPYRRTKRPKNYNDKSTITTCTPTAATDTPNVYDAVLGEAEDLLRAASDAQSLGRLKMASNYLLLLHARLVGLGKKFDRAKTAPGSGAGPGGAGGGPSMAEESTMKPTKLDMSPERTNKRKGATLAVCDTATVHHHHASSAAAAAASSSSPSSGNTTSAAEDTVADERLETPRKKRYEPPPSNIISEAALNQLTNYLPSNIELDQAMVEHLARAAAELHQKRTGKKTADEGLLNSPAMNTEEVFHYNKDTVPDNKDKSSPSCSSNSSSAAAAIAAAAAKRSKSSTNGSGSAAAVVASWSEEEQRKFQQALQKVGSNDPQQIAKLMGGTRTEVEVRAYLENVADLDLGNAMLDDTPRKRGGRGRKPPTTAMNTVPNANLDAKAMLSGAFFGL